MSNKAYLVLENGNVFEGNYFGYEKIVQGEIVFTTGMTGYLETFTDPSYYGQIVVQTFPLIGNYGIIKEDFESNFIWPSAYIVKNWCQEPSNFRGEGDLDTFFKTRKVTGLYGIDTRALTKIIRENGTMNGIITTNVNNVNFEHLKEYKVTYAVENVSTRKMMFEKSEESRYKVALINYGMKRNIARELLKRGCDLYIMPYNATAKDIESVNPDGIMLSNGPGNPEDNQASIQTLKELKETQIPIFGICLGHQLLALANGFETEKLKYGHRGANQAAKDEKTNRVYITSQNHGYTVKQSTIDSKVAKQRFVNVNDATCEGIEYNNGHALSVQFHPEACGGPHDSNFLFDEFTAMMDAYKAESGEENKNA